ncbi:MAG: hypothetical protein M1839_005014 [Geoglossum umbratile]|nr:MAG: hypothetical protein M1839_005014 [Geoglossum umbratile]
MPEVQTISEEQSGCYIDPARLEAFIKETFPGQKYKITQKNKIYRLEIPRKLTQDEIE